MSCLKPQFFMKVKSVCLAGTRIQRWSIPQTSTPLRARKTGRLRSGSARKAARKPQMSPCSRNRLSSGADRLERRALADHAVEPDHVIRAGADADVEGVLDDVPGEDAPLEVRHRALPGGANPGSPEQEAWSERAGLRAAFSRVLASNRGAAAASAGRASSRARAGSNAFLIACSSSCSTSRAVGGGTASNGTTLQPQISRRSGKLPRILTRIPIFGNVHRSRSEPEPRQSRGMAPIRSSWRGKTPLLAGLLARFPLAVARAALAVRRAARAGRQADRRDGQRQIGAADQRAGDTLHLEVEGAGGRRAGRR